MKSGQLIFHPKIKKKWHEIIFGNIFTSIYMHTNNFEIVTSIKKILLKKKILIAETWKKTFFLQILQYSK